jgi:hypothetical protein
MFKRLLFAVLLFIPATSRADFAAYKCIGPKSGPVRVTADNSGACTGFATRDKNVTFSRIASGTLVAAKDGRTVVMVEDYVHGRIKDGKLTAIYDKDVVVDPPVLAVYRDGKRVAAYDLATLVGKLDRVKQSISHVHWIDTLPTFDGNRITLTTVAKRIVLDAKTGKLLEQEETSRGSR